MENKLYLLSLLLVSIFYKAQYGDDNIQVHGNNIIIIGKRPITEQHVDGSKYYNGNSFDKVSILGYSKSIPEIRYDAFNDEMEYKQNETIYYLDKIENQEIFFSNLEKTYLCHSYKRNNKENVGFFVKLLRGEGLKYNLLAKEKIEKLNGEKSINGIATDKNDYYVKAKIEYFIFYKDNISQFPKSIKECSEFFSINKIEMDEFVKLNKINFSNPEDLVKIVYHFNKL